MRKSKKRVIAIITCCFVLAALCVVVFADETTQEDTYDPAMDRVGSILTITPYDLGELVVDFDNTSSYNVTSGYYICKVDYKELFNSSNSLTIITNNGIGTFFTMYKYESESLRIRDKSMNTGNDSSYISIGDIGTYYIYIYVNNDNTFIRNEAYQSAKCSISIYSISNRSVIDSVYSNSQDVNSSIVSVINEATNVITTNDVVMMFCVLIPVISFGAGILIRLRKRA